MSKNVRIIPRRIPEIEFLEPFVRGFALLLIQMADDDGAVLPLEAMKRSQTRRSRLLIDVAYAALFEAGFMDGGGEKDDCPRIVGFERFAAPEKRTKPREGIRNSVRFDILASHGFACRYCGRRAPSVELQMEHIVPVANGGTNDRRNLVAACTDCNAGKHTKSVSLSEDD